VRWLCKGLTDLEKNVTNDLFKENRVTLMSKAKPVRTRTPQDRDALHSLGYMSDVEVSAALGIGRRALWVRRRERRGLPFIRQGRVLLYRISDVQRYLDSLIVQPLTPAVPRQYRAVLDALQPRKPRQTRKSKN